MAKFKAPKSRKIPNQTSATLDKSIPTIASCLLIVLAGIGLITWLFYGLLTAPK